MSVVEYELGGSKKEIDTFIANLEADRYIKVVEIDNTNYTYISVAFDTDKIKCKLKSFMCYDEIIEAITDLLGENWNVYDAYTVEDCIDSLTSGRKESKYIFEWIDSYLEGMLSEKDYNNFLDCVAQYKEY